MNNKIYDCFTFFQENFITNLRFEILDEFVDYFIICESLHDHRGNKKKLNFKLKNSKFKKKIIYLVYEEPFKNNNDRWENQAKQREHIFKGLNEAAPNDYIMFSDPDEIPRPDLLKNLDLKKKIWNIFTEYLLL